MEGIVVTNGAGVTEDGDQDGGNGIQSKERLECPGFHGGRAGGGSAFIEVWKVSDFFLELCQVSTLKVMVITPYNISPPSIISRWTVYDDRALPKDIVHQETLHIRAGWRMGHMWGSPR